MKTSHIEWATPLYYTDEEAKNLSAAGINLVPGTDNGYTAANIVNYAVIKQLENALNVYQVSVDTLKSIFDAQVDDAKQAKAALTAACTERKEEALEL